MLRLTLLAMLACAAWAQGDNPFNRPPAEVDKALRARIMEFFQYHVTGEYRKAEALVAEDTKDYFYDHNKPKYMSVEISKIEYFDNFTKAKAIVLCEQRINNPAFGNRTFKVPTPSSWKLEKGQWYWWVEPENMNLTPFGRMTPGPEVAGTKAAAAPTMPNIPSTGDFLFDQVKLDKKQLTVPAGRSEVVTIHNTAPGVMNISVIQAPQGIEAKLSKSSLNSDEKATLTVTSGKEPQSGELHLQVEPIGQKIVIPIVAK
jgi:hypothetical protein